MNERNRNWYEAIELRHSRRKYVPTPVEPEKLETLAELIEELNRSSDAWRITLVRSHDEAIFSGIRGGYGIIKGSPSYLAFIGAPEESERHEELGYIGEAAVLEATHLGLGTCWVTGTFDPAAAAKDLDLASSERLFAVSPLGYPRDSYSFTEKVMKRAAGSRSRKPLDELCVGDELARWPEWARTAAEAARRAPSALNRQPWLFRFEGEELSVEVDAKGGGNSRGTASKRLDCGIALRHLVVGAQYSLDAPVSLSPGDARRITGVRPGGW
jgi:nitroreductase